MFNPPNSLARRTLLRLFPHTKMLRLGEVGVWSRAVCYQVHAWVNSTTSFLFPAQAVTDLRSPKNPSDRSCVTWKPKMSLHELKEPHGHELLADKTIASRPYPSINQVVSKGKRTLGQQTVLLSCALGPKSTSWNQFATLSWLFQFYWASWDQMNRAKEAVGRQN